MVFLWNHGYCELQQLIQHQGQYILQSSDRGKNQNIIQYLLSDYQPGIYLLEEVLQPTFRTLTVTHQQKADLVVFMN